MAPPLRVIITVIVGLFFIGGVPSLSEGDDLMEQDSNQDLRLNDGTGMEDFIDIEPCDYHPDYDFVISINEGAEETLGREAFGSLQERFSKVPGVKKVIHEDREIFLVKVENLDAQTLRRQFWQVIVKAQSDNYRESGI